MAKRRRSVARDQPIRPIDRAIAQFQLATEWIQKEYDQRRQRVKLSRNDGRYVRPWDSAENFAKREAYALILKTLAMTSGKSAIKKIVKINKAIPKSPLFDENPFYWGLLAMDLFDHENNPTMKVSSYAPDLFYAYKHRVPSAYLTGFIHQVGRRSTIRKTVEEEKTEKEFLELARRNEWP